MKWVTSSQSLGLKISNVNENNICITDSVQQVLPFNHRKMSKPTHPNPNLSYLSPPKKKIGSPVLFSQNNRDIQTGMAVNLYWLSVFITSKGKIVFFGRNLQGENSLVKRISLGKFQINFLGRHFSERCFHCYFSERCFISYHLIMRVP